MHLLPLSSVSASLMTRFFTNGAKILATGLIEVSPSIHVFAVPSYSVHVPLESLLLSSYPCLPSLDLDAARSHNHDKVATVSGQGTARSSSPKY